MASNTMAIYEKDGRRFKMTAEHAERVGATLVEDEGTGARRTAKKAAPKKAPAARNKKAEPAANKSADDTDGDSDS